MTNHDHSLSTIRNLRITTEAKARIRADLSAYADFHTYTPSVGRAITATYFSRHLLSLYGIRALSVLLVVGIFSGTAAASTSSLPGDVLYPVKVRVAEPVQTALITTAAGKATWQASLAERRLEEAARLAVELRLDPETEQALANSFEAHVQDSLASAEAVEQSGDIITSLEVRSDLEAKVTAHKTILQSVVDRLPDTDQSDAISPAEGLLQVVSDTRVVVAAERESAEVALAVASSSGTDVAVATTPTDADPAATADADVAATLSVLATAATVTDVQIAQTTVAREQEIASILEKHSDLLGNAATPPATVDATATTTATTTPLTATTTPTELSTSTPVFIPAAGAPLEVLRTTPTLRQNLNLQRTP